MTSSASPSASWDAVRTQLIRVFPQLFELEPGGALGMELGNGGWMLELTPDGRLICQNGVDMDDVRSLLSSGTTEDLANDELAKQAKAVLNPAVAKVRSLLVKAGYQERTEMTEEYVAILFEKTVDFSDFDRLQAEAQWCLRQAW
jgi:hypothetical protein